MHYPLPIILIVLLLPNILCSIVPKVDTGYAIYSGNHSITNTAAFLGVPYAEPPLGDGRFKAPKPLDTTMLNKNKQIFDSSQYPGFCNQGTTGG